MKKQIFFMSWLLICSIFFACERDKINPGFTKQGDQTLTSAPKHTALVEKKQVTRMYEAVGTIRPLTKSVIESQVSAQIKTISCVPGTPVKKGEILIRLDARQMETQLKQAGEGLNVAKNRLKQTLKSMDEARAGLDQAMAAYNRSKSLFESGVISSQKLEIDKAGYLQAKARFEKAQEAERTGKASIRKAQEVVREADIGVDYTAIVSPSTGVVVERLVDPGDLAIPGKPLLVIQTSGALRLEANVREGLISRVVMGNPYFVRIGTVEKTVESIIEEIVPYADPATRTFLVKASLPETPGIYPGMFGRLMIPVEKEETLLIPQNAVIFVGQLELALVKEGEEWQRVYIKTGKKQGDKIEVLAGLFGGETIGYQSRAKPGTQ